MKVIIDPYRGGTDIGRNISGKYEKNILLQISKYMSNKLLEKGIDSELVRTIDVSLTDDERISIINEIKTDKDLIIQNRLSEDGNFDIIYPIRNTEKLPHTINENLKQVGVFIDKYYQRRLPTNTALDYYNIIRNTKPNETIIIEYKNPFNYQLTVDTIVRAISTYLKHNSVRTTKKHPTSNKK